MLRFLILTLLLLSISTHSLWIQETQPHNHDCYSQGLFFINSTHLFQSCGLYKKSYYHVLEYSSNPFTLKENFKSIKPWKEEVFLEGAVEFEGFIYMLTWKEHIVYKLDPLNYAYVSQLQWSKAGWGLTSNKTHMFTTDGSDKIYLVNGNFNLLETKKITDETGRKVFNINELQYVDGYIYANIYYKNVIVKINYEKGKVVDEYDAVELTSHELGLRSDEVLNGIAYNTGSKKFILTGKNWKNFYQVDL